MKIEKRESQESPHARGLTKDYINDRNELKSNEEN
jgi:hypothetical protein